MYKILLVEDETIIRNGLKYIISRMDLDIGDIYEASNGKEAIELYKKFLPQIIITDIKMPEMDGLEFIGRIKKLGVDPKFIILSGYNEFSYAQKAITYKVAEYLLKPIKKNILYNVLKKLILQYEDEKASTLRNISNLHKTLLCDVLQGHYKPDEISKVLNEAGITFAESSFLVLSFYMIPDDDFSVTDGMQYLIKNCISHFFDFCFYSRTKYMYNTLLFNLSKNDTEKYDELIKALKDTLQKIHKEKNVVMQIGISEAGTGLETLPELFRQSEAALDFKGLYYIPDVYVYSRIKRPKSNNSLPIVYFEQIYSAISKTNRNDIVLTVHKLFDYLLGISNVTPDLIIYAVKSMENFIVTADENLYAYYANLTETENSVEFLYRTSATIKDFISGINKKLFLLSAHISSSDNIKAYNPIGYAVEYIRKNYNKDLNLAIISNMVSMNSNYFSSLFKKKTGLSFVNFLQTVRVEKSKALLMEPGPKIYEIAEKVGYNDEKYYCKVFKAITGVSPNDYRQQEKGDVFCPSICNNP
jgi:two-component system, response regulator YesN